MRVLLAAVVAVLVAAAPAEAAWEYTTDRSKINFVQNCFPVKRGYFDPIVFPGSSNASHNHTFFGNLGVQPSSTPQSLIGSGTNCQLSRNRTSYWTPTFYADGVAVLPDQAGMAARAYYRANAPVLSAIRPVPFGLKIIAGDANATRSSPQSASVAGFQCRDAGGNTVAKSALPPDCPRGDYLEASLTFPNCWDGRNLDSADHKSHMVYRRATENCPTSHPVRLPQLVLALRFPTDAFLGKRLTMASNVSKTGGDPESVAKLHGDAMFAWDPATMRELVEHCLHASIACEGVRDDRLPPSMGGLPPAEWPASSSSFAAGGRPSRVCVLR